MKFGDFHSRSILRVGLLDCYQKLLHLQLRFFRVRFGFSAWVGSFWESIELVGLARAWDHLARTTRIDQGFWGLPYRQTRKTIAIFWVLEPADNILSWFCFSFRRVRSHTIGYWTDYLGLFCFYLSSGWWWQCDIFSTFLAPCW